MESVKNCLSQLFQFSTTSGFEKEIDSIQMNCQAQKVNEM